MYEDLTSKEKLLEEMQIMNSFGSRLTGTEGQSGFCNWLKSEISSLGINVQNKVYTFDRWDAHSASLVADGKEMHIASVFPYSGLTDENGVEAELVSINNSLIGFAMASGKIGVIKIKDLRGITSKIAFDMRSAYPKDLKIDSFYKGPVATSFVKTLFTFWAAKLSGMKGLICIWEGISDDMAEGQWLNFILGYLGVPAVWVNADTGKELWKMGKHNKIANLKIIGEIEKKSKTESFYAVIKGTTNDKEAVIINTHTDGCNFAEENGGIALLSLIRHFKNHPTERTLIFVFVTGHFRLPSFRVGFDQATSKWLADNKNVWKKSHGGYNVVAACSLEHLGCTEWKDVKGVYQKTDDIDKEVVYTGNPTMDKIYFEACEGRTRLRTITQRGHNFLHFGEGQPLYNKGIPEISLVTAPDYLCAVDSTGNSHMDKFNLDLMYEQIQTFAKCIDLIDKKSAKELGRAQAYSLGLGRLKRRVY